MALTKSGIGHLVQGINGARLAISSSFLIVCSVGTTQDFAELAKELVADVLFAIKQLIGEVLYRITDISGFAVDVMGVVVTYALVADVGGGQPIILNTTLISAIIALAPEWK